jgi:hypothetical protein
MIFKTSPNLKESHAKIEEIVPIVVDSEHVSANDWLVWGGKKLEQIERPGQRSVRIKNQSCSKGVTLAISKPGNILQ